MKRYRALLHIIENSLAYKSFFCLNDWRNHFKSKLLRSVAYGLSGDEEYNRLRATVTAIRSRRHLWQGLFLCMLGIAWLLCTFSPTASADKVLLFFNIGVIIFSSFLCGCIATVLALHRLDPEEKEHFESFLSSLVEVLWGVVEYEQGARIEKFPKRAIRRILLGENSLEWWLKPRTDKMLIRLAFQVKSLEHTKLAGDNGLEFARGRFRGTHLCAVAVRLAVQNPKTYFDRAIPASQDPQAKSMETVPK